MDPYRNDINSRVKNLEEQVSKLKEDIGEKKGLMFLEIRKSLTRALTDGETWAAIAVFVVSMTLIIGFPACVKSCDAVLSDSPEEIQARQEADAARVEQQKTSCAALDLKFVGYDQSHDKLTCGNNSSIVVIDLDDGMVIRVNNDESESSESL